MEELSTYGGQRMIYYAGKYSSSNSVASTQNPTIFKLDKFWICKNRLITLLTEGNVFCFIGSS